MKNICIGDKYQIQCYKHDGSVHRAWEEAIVLDVKKDYIVFANKKTLVTRAEGISWKTKEPAIMYYFKHKWYNIIAQMKKEGFSYYCNIASPYIIEEGTVKYVDYDLDLRIYPSGEYKVLDKLEYQYHKRIMNYSEELDKVIQNGLDELIMLYKRKSPIYKKEKNYEYYRQYEELKKLDEKE